MINKKAKLSVTNMVVMLALIAALVGVSCQQVGAQRATPPEECSAKVDKLADKDDVRSDCVRDEKSEEDDDGMETLAALIGIDGRRLWAEIKAGNSIASVAQANGVEPQTIIDALVAEVQAEIDAAVAAGRISPEEAAQKSAGLVEHFTHFLNDTANALKKDGKRHEWRAEMLETAANLIGIDVRRLWAEIKAGNSIASVAQANGVEAQTIIDALVAEVQAEIDAGVAAGHISPEEAAQKSAGLVEHFTHFVNNTANALKKDGKRDEDESLASGVIERLPSS